jgi:hypothetical protein
LVDSYTIFAASVLAANGTLRSLFGAAFPLFTKNMYDNLGIHWASTIPACLALVCVPFPFLFYKYGGAIRSKCAYAAQSEAIMAQLRTKANEPEARVQVSEEKNPERTNSASTDSSSGHEGGGARFEPIKTRNPVVVAGDADGQPLTKVKSAGSIVEAANYQASPYDIDRVNTSTSLAGLDLTQTKTNKSVER